MGSRLFFLYFAVVVQLLLPQFELLASNHETEAQPSIAKRYDEAKLYYNQLQTNPNLSASREYWLQATRNFRRIYLAGPKSDLAPACLFMLGRVYGDMHDRFHNSADLEESLAYFKDITRLFPEHRLADDGYYALARLSLEKQHNPLKAAGFIRRIVSDYPNGDMHPKAMELLKSLSGDHDIPQPNMMVSPTAHSNLKSVLPAKYWSSDDYTRVVIKASAPVIYKEVLLKETDHSPRKLKIDFKNSYIEPQYRATLPIEDGLLRKIHTAQFSPDTVRVILDIESIDDYKIFNLPDPFRVVIDVHGKSRQQKITPVFIAVTKKKIMFRPESGKDSHIVMLRDGQKKILAPPAKGTGRQDLEASARTSPLTLAQQLGLGVKKIVLDPGHGGKDPGAMAFGLKEKDIVLDIGKKLAPVLEKELGCEVLLTRDRDVFIPLEERTAIANTQKADLFVSLHINAHPSPEVRGLETYYLNLSTNAEAMRVAARENATSTHQLSDLQDILSDILKNSKISESSRLAQQVHDSIIGQAGNPRFTDMKNLGVKQAPFYVLIGAQMPAILIEIAFISNEQDAGNLQNPEFVKMVIQEIAMGIRAYVSQTTAQL
jgi:N-acetylmuramoyl-L-alanine amidase